MRLQNNRSGYGLVAIGLHWVMALLILGLFVLGNWMVELDYAHPWYQKAPDLHRSTGIVVALLLAIRFAWRLVNPRPVILGARWERFAAVWVHRILYLLMTGTVVSGYLITTADGQGIAVFGWFEIPAYLYGYPHQADVAGEIHESLATFLITLAGFHTLAALKHHFIDRDETLIRILRVSRSRSPHHTH